MLEGRRAEPTHSAADPAIAIPKGSEDTRCQIGHQTSRTRALELT